MCEAGRISNRSDLYVLPKSLFFLAISSSLTRLRFVSGAPAAQVLRELLYLVAVLFDQMADVDDALVAGVGALVLVVEILILVVMILVVMILVVFLVVEIVILSGRVRGMRYSHGVNLLVRLAGLREVPAPRGHLYI
jgi:hypothetical protein